MNSFRSGSVITGFTSGGGWQLKNYSILMGNQKNVIHCLKVVISSSHTVPLNWLCPRAVLWSPVGCIYISANACHNCCRFLHCNNAMLIPSRPANTGWGTAAANTGLQHEDCNRCLHLAHANTR